MVNNEKMLQAFQDYIMRHKDEYPDTPEGHMALTAAFNEYYLAHKQEIESDGGATQRAAEYAKRAVQARSDSEFRKYTLLALDEDLSSMDTISEGIFKGPGSFHEILARHALFFDISRQYMADEGWMDEPYMGQFWAVLETRPFMRLCSTRADIFQQLRQYQDSMEMMEYMIHLCNHDNLGKRGCLISHYAYYMLEDRAVELITFLSVSHGDDPFDPNDDSRYIESQTALPLSVLYYKERKYDFARNLLGRMLNTNKETLLFFQQASTTSGLRALMEKDKGDYVTMMTMQEYVLSLQEGAFMYQQVPEYFPWALSKIQSDFADRLAKQSKTPKAKPDINTGKVVDITGMTFTQPGSSNTTGTVGTQSDPSSTTGTAGTIHPRKIHKKNARHKKK